MNQEGIQEFNQSIGSLIFQLKSLYFICSSMFEMKYQELCIVGFLLHNIWISDQLKLFFKVLTDMFAFIFSGFRGFFVGGFCIHWWKTREKDYSTDDAWHKDKSADDRSDDDISLPVETTVLRPHITTTTVFTNLVLWTGHLTDTFSTNKSWKCKKVSVFHFCFTLT